MTADVDVAALFVESDGPYAIAGVDLWPIARDARLYEGPYPVVAHPPCQRWGRYARGGPNPLARAREVGDDDGCFASALASVRKYGGVIEHPEASHAWAHFGIARPIYHGGWIKADDFGGMTCCVAQGNYGHESQKLTWLYACRTLTPDLVWGRTPGRPRLDQGFGRSGHAHGKMERLIKDNSARTRKITNLYTPIPFRDLLLALARSVYFTG